MKVSIDPATRGLRGRIAVPGDKSISHRSFLINALAPGSARVSGVLQAEDVACSRALVEKLGVRVTSDRTGLRLDIPERLVGPATSVDCGNSGTTARLAMGLCTHASGVTTLTGDHSLSRRPMGRVSRPLGAMGARIEGGDRLPLSVHGGPLERFDHTLPIASAQVKSALLLAGRDCGVAVAEPRQSRDHTERFLRAMGADLSVDEGRLVLEPSTWTPVDVEVPGDISSAAFWMVAGSVVEGSELTLQGVGLNPSRLGILDALRAMGADITVGDVRGGVEPRGDMVVRSAGLKGTRIGGELALRSLDELPVLAVAAVMAEGETVISDAAELRVKESDRIARVVAGLRSLGAAVEERPDGMVIAGGGFECHASIDADGDHRLAMAFSIAGLVAPRGCEIAHAEAVRTSYPAFYEELLRVQG